MKNYQNIICAVDFSGEEKLVVSRAADLAQKHETTLTLLHVIDPAEYQKYSSMPEFGWVTYAQLDAIPQTHEQRAIIEGAHNRLQALGEFAKIENTNHEVTFNSDASDAICEYAKDNNADLIVVGSHGRHGLMQLFTNTTVETVVNKAPCDVYSVYLKGADE